MAPPKAWRSAIFASLAVSTVVTLIFSSLAIATARSIMAAPGPLQTLGPDALDALVMRPEVEAPLLAAGRDARTGLMAACLLPVGLLAAWVLAAYAALLRRPTTVAGEAAARVAYGAVAGAALGVAAAVLLAALVLHANDGLAEGLERHGDWSHQRRGVYRSLWTFGYGAAGVHGGTAALLCLGARAFFEAKASLVAPAGAAAYLA